MADPGPVCKTFGLDPVVNRCSPGTTPGVVAGAWWIDPCGEDDGFFLAEGWSLGGDGWEFVMDFFVFFWFLILKK